MVCVKNPKARVVHSAPGPLAPPHVNVCKLNFDGSKRGNGNAALGFVIRNSHGEVLLA